MEESIQEVKMQRIILGDWFQAPAVKTRYFHVILVDNYGILYRKVKAGEKRPENGSPNIELKEYSQYERLLFKDIVGCHCMRDPEKPQHNGQVGTENAQSGSQCAYFCIYAYPLKKKSFRKVVRRQRMSLTLAVNSCETYAENLAVAEKWRNEIHAALNGLILLIGWCIFLTKFLVLNGTRPMKKNSASNLNKSPGAVTSSHPESIEQNAVGGRKLLVFVSPKSGPGKALTIFQQRIAPVLGEASVAYDLIVTERQNHARDYVKNADLSTWNGIVTVAGDGLIYEIVNGIMSRPDWNTAIKTPIGVVPGGSGNGLSHSIAYAVGEPANTSPVLLSAINVAKARIVPMDLVRVETMNGALYSFLSIGWGMMADIDIESERLRAIGESRFTLWALHRIARLKFYRGRLSYLPIPGYEPPKNVPNPGKRSKYPPIQRTQSSYPPEASARPNLVASKSLPEHLEAIDDTEDDPNSSFAMDALAETDIQDSGAASLPVPTPAATNGDAPGHVSILPPLDAPVPDDWVQREDDYIMIYVVYQTHIGSTIIMAPEASMDDGIMWLILVRKGATRTQLISFMFALESGNHVNQSFVEMLPIRAFRLEPLTEGGHMTVDGELIDYGPIQAEVMPSMARIMAH